MSSETLLGIGGVGLALAIGLVIAWLARRPATWNTEALPIVDPVVTVLTREYRGSPADAAALCSADTRALAAFGYAPISQAFAPGTWGTGPFIFAALMILMFGFGLLVIAYLLIVKPPGTLAVTYHRRGPDSPAHQVFPVAPRSVQAPSGPSRR